MRVNKTSSTIIHSDGNQEYLVVYNKYKNSIENIFTYIKISNFTIVCIENIIYFLLIMLKYGRPLV